MGFGGARSISSVAFSRGGQNRTKNKRQHELPLSDAASAILERQPRRKGRDLFSVTVWTILWLERLQGSAGQTFA